MKMKALESFHTKETRTVHPGDEFEVPDALGKEFEQRGLAEKTGDSDPEEKAEPELLNKMEPVSENKVRRRKARVEEDAQPEAGE